MESLICGFVILGVIGISLFFFLRNTARKKSQPVSTTGLKDYTPVYVSLADKPESILLGMDRFVTEVNRTESAGDKWRKVPLFIFFGGLGLMLIDGLINLLKYSSFIFSTGGLVIWFAAFIMAISLRRSDTKEFSPRYEGTKDILHTLRDDLKPGSTFIGHLDLTGAMVKSKVARETKDSRERTTQHFRDEWLSLKAKLYDGNVLRVTAIQRSKQRQPYWKRSSISGKTKQKPAKFKGSEQQLKVRLAVNPEVYSIVPNKTFKEGVDIGKYRIAHLSTEGGIVDVLASSPFEEVESEHILGLLQSTYSLLQRKAA